MTKKAQRGRTPADAERTDGGPGLSQLRVKPQTLVGQIPHQAQEQLNAEMAAELQERWESGEFPAIAGSSEDGCCFTVAKKMCVGYSVSITPPQHGDDACGICAEFIGVACCPPPPGACENNNCGITVISWVPVSVKFEVVTTDLCKVHCRILDMICCNC